MNNTNLTYKEIDFPLNLRPIAVYKSILPHCENAFLLESLGSESNFSRFTYIGFNPKKVINSSDYIKEDVLGHLRHILPSIPDTQGFCGGLVGYFSHESTKYFEPEFTGSSHEDFPDFAFGLYLDGLKYDKKNRKFVYFYLDKNRLDILLEILSKPAKRDSFSFKFLGKNKTESQYKQMFLRAKQEIYKGNIFQIVISLKNYYSITGNPFHIYHKLREINPSPHMYYLKFSKQHIIGASPELLIRLKGDKLEHFGTLAGTIRRGRTKSEDQLLEHQLQKDIKEKAEHMMLVDLARNDIGRICEFGSIKVKNLLKVKKFSHVQHLCTEITGILRKEEDAFSTLAACFPAGTLTGAPKIEAMKIIHQLEEDPRGPYGGVVGYFSVTGDCMFAISIRSLYISGQKSYTQVGSGIVYDSILTKEYQEIKEKHEAMRLALERAKYSIL